MRVMVTARKFALTTDARDRAVSTLAKVERLLGGRRPGGRAAITAMDIVFTSQRNPRISAPVVCEVTVHAKGHRLHAEASGADADAAVDAVWEKLARQARTRKGKRTRRGGAERRGDVADGRVRAVV